MDIEGFKTAGEWYRKMKADGYQIPLSLYHTLIKLMKDERISFQDAYKALEDKGRIKVINKTINFDLNEKQFIKNKLGRIAETEKQLAVLYESWF